MSLNKAISEVVEAARARLDLAHRRAATSATSGESFADALKAADSESGAAPAEPSASRRVGQGPAAAYDKPSAPPAAQGKTLDLLS